jgi:hypothetical protein
MEEDGSKDSSTGVGGDDGLRLDMCAHAARLLTLIWRSRLEYDVYAMTRMLQDGWLKTTAARRCGGK